MTSFLAESFLLSVAPPMIRRPALEGLMPASINMFVELSDPTLNPNPEAPKPLKPLNP